MKTFVLDTNVILHDPRALFATPHEMKTVISRVGMGSKIVLTGDPYQIDKLLPRLGLQRPDLRRRPL